MGGADNIVLAGLGGEGSGGLAILPFAVQAIVGIEGHEELVFSGLTVALHSGVVQILVRSLPRVKKAAIANLGEIVGQLTINHVVEYLRRPGQSWQS
jgi:hypothetical protein